MALEPPWNSLEIARLIVDFLTPLILLGLGIWVNRLTHHVEARQWTNQKVVEKRLAIYDEVAPLLNDLYCYFNFVGNWKELTPSEIISIKRKLDKHIYIYAPLFSPAFLSLYHQLIQTYFQTYTGANFDARLNTAIESPSGNRRAMSREPWNTDWDRLFALEKEDLPSTRSAMREAYDTFMSCFAKEIGIGIDRPPQN